MCGFKYLFLLILFALILIIHLKLFYYNNIFEVFFKCFEIITNREPEPIIVEEVSLTFYEQILKNVVHLGKVLSTHARLSWS